MTEDQWTESWTRRWPSIAQLLSDVLPAWRVSSSSGRQQRCKYTNM